MNRFLVACAGASTLWAAQSVSGQVIGLASDNSQDGGLPVPRVSVTAEATIPVRADKAIVYFAVSTDDTTAAVAASDNAELQARLTTSLTALGVPEAAITVWGFGLGERGGPYRMRREAGMPDARPEIRARAGIRVIVDSIEQLADVVEAALWAGDVSVPAVLFEATDVSDARRQALENAIAQAHLDAEVMARAAGGELGELLLLNTTPVFDVANRMSWLGAYAMGQDQVPLTPSDVEVRIGVNASWRFRN